MKNKILLVLLLVAVFGLGILSVKAHDRYQAQERARAEAVQLEVQERERAEAEKAETEKRTLEQLGADCMNGQKAYDLLSKTMREGIVRPECVTLW